MSDQDDRAQKIEAAKDRAWTRVRDWMRDNADGVERWRVRQMTSAGDWWVFVMDPDHGDCLSICVDDSGRLTEKWLSDDVVKAITEDRPT